MTNKTETKTPQRHELKNEAIKALSIRALHVENIEQDSDGDTPRGEKLSRLEVTKAIAIEVDKAATQTLLASTLDMFASEGTRGELTEVTAEKFPDVSLTDDEADAVIKHSTVSTVLTMMSNLSRFIATDAFTNVLIALHEQGFLFNDDGTIDDAAVDRAATGFLEGLNYEIKETALRNITRLIHRQKFDA